MMNDASMNHAESPRVPHERSGDKTKQLNENVTWLLDFVRDSGMPYILSKVSELCKW